MKQMFSKYLLAGSLLLSVPVAIFAQDGKTKTDQKTKKEKGEVQQIIITRTADQDEKTVVEIRGDEVLVNGRNVKELKNGNVTVNINRLRDVDALVGSPARVRARTYAPATPGRSRTFEFFNDQNGMRFFAEDSTRPMLGVVTAPDERGVKISSVNKESGAEKAGLKPGDVITEIDGEKMEDPGDVTTAVRKHKPGEKVSVSYLRDGKLQKTTAELSRWKGLRISTTNDKFDVYIPGNVAPLERNGRFNVDDFDFDFGGRPKLGVSVQDSEDGKGVVVQDVEEESNAAKAGIREGDVITHFNDTAINDVSDMRRELATHRDKISARIKLLRGGKEQTLEVKMPRKLKSADL